MASKGVVSLLIEAKDEATKVIKKAYDSVASGAKTALGPLDQLRAGVGRAIDSLRNLAGAGAGVGRAGAGLKDVGAGADKAALSAEQLTAAIATISDELAKAQTDFRTSKSDTTQFAAATDKAEQELLQLGGATNLTGKQLKQYNSTLDQVAKAKKHLAGDSIPSVKDALKELSREIPFASQGMRLLEAVAGSIPAQLTLAAGAMALVAFEAIKMADEVNRSLRVIQNQVPGAAKSFKELQDIVREAGESDPLAHTQAEIAGIGRVISRNGVPSLKQFKENLDLVLKASAATGEEAATVAEGLDLVSDAFQLTGKDLQETFAKIVVATNGLVPLPDLFQQLGRGATTLKAFGIDAETAARAVASFADAGIPAREAGTAFIRVLDHLTEIANPTSDAMLDNAEAAKALGLNVKKLVESGAPLEQVLGAIQRASHGSNGALRQMGFTFQEATAILRGDFRGAVLDAKDALEKLDEQAKNAGNSAGTMAKRLHNELDDQLIKLGNVLLPATVSQMQSLVDLLNGDIGHGLKKELGDVAKILELITGLDVKQLKNDQGAGPIEALLGKLGLVNTKLDEALKKQKVLVNGEADFGGFRGLPGGKRAPGALDEPLPEDKDAADRAEKLARAAAERRRNEERFKKELEDQVSLLGEIFKSGHETAKDREKLSSLEASLNQQLKAQGISVERRLTLEKALSAIQDIREGALQNELKEIEARAGFGKATIQDVTRLHELEAEIQKKLEDQNTTTVEKIRLYGELLAIAEALSKLNTVPLPDQPDRNGLTTDTTRVAGSASVKDEQALRDAANRPASQGGGGFISGIGGEPGQSPLAEQRAEAAGKAAEEATKRTDEFSQALRNAVAGPMADFFNSLLRGKASIEGAVSAISESVVGLFSQKLANKIIGTGERVSPLLKDEAGKEALNRAEAAEKAAQNAALTSAAASVTAGGAQVAAGGVAVQAAAATIPPAGAALTGSAGALTGSAGALTAAAAALQAASAAQATESAASGVAKVAETGAAVAGAAASSAASSAPAPAVARVQKLTVDAPKEIQLEAPGLKVGELAPAEMDAPDLKVQDPGQVSLDGPEVKIQELDPVKMAAPDLKVQDPARVSLDAPDLKVAALAPKTLDAPALDVPAPRVDMAKPAPVALPAPSFSMPRVPDIGDVSLVGAAGVGYGTEMVAPTLRAPQAPPRDVEETAMGKATVELQLPEGVSGKARHDDKQALRVIFRNRRVIRDALKDD